MKAIKKLLKRLLPAGLIKLLLPIYHRSRAILANVINGFPSRHMNVVAITGTNGKTTTGALLASILEADGYKVGVSGTAFFKIGDELTMNDSNMTVTNPFKLQKLLRKMSKAHVDIVILEVTSHALVQSRVWGIKPVLALMTNLTQDHLDYHKTMENYAAAKGRLFAMKPNFIILNRDDQWYDFYDKYLAKEAKYSYGANPAADVQLTHAKLGSKNSELTISLRGDSINVKTNLIGKFNSYNALAAVAAAYALEVDSAGITQGLHDLKNVPGRLETVAAGQDFNVFIDYAHTPDALENVLSTLDALGGRIITVFGATGDRDRSKRPIMAKVVAKYSAVAIISDEEPYTENADKIRREVELGFEDSKADCEVHNIADRKEAIKKAIGLAKKGDSVIVAGLGSQSYRTFGDEKHAWNEREIVEELLKESS